MRLRAALAAAIMVPVALGSVPAEARPAAATSFYDQADAAARIDAALADAARTGRTALIVFGADWCHDSRALAASLTSDKFARRFDAGFTVLFVDVGKPQTGAGLNLDQTARFGIADLKSTPAMVAIAPSGERINTVEDAVSWRNAEARGQSKLFDWLRALQTRPR